MKRRNGKTSWIEGITSTVRGAIMEADRIASDVTDGEYEYTVTLAPATAGPPWWKGGWKCKTDTSSGYADAKLYSASDGGLVLVGTWAAICAG